jgi:hypothetical protein
MQKIANFNSEATRSLLHRRAQTMISHRTVEAATILPDKIGGTRMKLNAGQ